MPFESPAKLGGQSGVKKKFLTYFQYGPVFLKWLIFCQKLAKMAGIRISRTIGPMKLLDPSDESQSSIFGSIYGFIDMYTL